MRPSLQGTWWDTMLLSAQTPGPGIVTGVPAGEGDRQWTAVGMVMDSETKDLDFSWCSAVPALAKCMCKERSKNVKSLIVAIYIIIIKVITRKKNMNFVALLHACFLVLHCILFAFWGLQCWQVACKLFDAQDIQRSILPKLYPGICHYPCDLGQVCPSLCSSVFFFVVDQGYVGSRGWVEVRSFKLTKQGTPINFDSCMLLPRKIADT